MAEHDNLLAEVQGWLDEVEYTGNHPYLVERLAAAVRALQTENTDKTARLDEAEEKLAVLGAGCYNATGEELIERISAVGPARFKAGDWLADRIDKATEPLRTENTELRRQIANVEAKRDATSRVAMRSAVPTSPQPPRRQDSE